MFEYIYRKARMNTDVYLIKNLKDLFMKVESEDIEIHPNYS